jgi:hypothetical protein
MQYKNKYRKGINVTVCVAAIFNGTSVVGASDRMLTAGDIEFEPQQSKVFQLTSSISVMVAGDSSLQMEIILNVKNEVNNRIDENPKEWWSVKDIAELYEKYYLQARTKRAESKILAPLGIDHNTFVSRQREMDSGLVQQIAAELINFQLSAVEAIFTGVDNSGIHIYVVSNGHTTCQDAVGFAAIGVGAWHASSQLMFAGHNKYKPFPETLLSVYFAKKRAEVAPGVGEATDMFWIGPALGSYSVFGDHVLERLKEIYKDEQEREQEAAIKARESIYQYVDEIAKAAEASVEQEAITADGRASPSPDEKES